MEVELATTDADGAGHRIPHDEIPHDYAVHVFRCNASEKWKYSVDLGRWLRDNARRFDVLHIHALWSYASIAAARAAARADVPFILRPAGMLSTYSLTHGAWKKRISWHLLERPVIARAAAFHATSSAEAEEIRNVRPDAIVHVIPNGVHPDAFTAEPTLAHANANCRRLPSQPFVLFLSRLHPKKGIIDLLLPAWAQVKTDAVLAIAGGPDAHQPDYARLVRDEVARLGLRERVMFLGEIQPHERWALFDTAELFVLPSHSENFGVVVAEAMARGCPVVVTEQVQAAEHVLAAGGGTVVPRRILHLATALGDMLSNSERLNACGESGRRYAQQHFCWPRVVGSICRMYQGTVHVAPPAGAALC
jgi:glycosyltransferase involved in cell wall biosynthesis